MEPRRPVPCPNCGGINIGVKENTIRTAGNQLVVKCWAYCRICNQKGTDTICEINAEEADIIEAAYKTWNKDR